MSEVTKLEYKGVHHMALVCQDLVSIIPAWALAGMTKHAYFFPCRFT